MSTAPATPIGVPIALETPDLKVVWVDLGEGLNGDFDPTDPDDRSLLRFDVHERGAEGWVPVESGSYCTLVPSETPAVHLVSMLLTILYAVDRCRRRDVSAKHTLEALSWLDGAVDGECDQGVGR
jgi:hypothetical protein